MKRTHGFTIILIGLGSIYGLSFAMDRFPDFAIAIYVVVVFAYLVLAGALQTYKVRK
ncbi:MAG: hypothetical protein QUV02_01045 [Maricaulis sp.]|uniref:hypothetical protein n=1 Tax=Maricaulis sp. TaxID=1486257 RepID=UPI001B0C08AD|nr:hypothetical protein [Maricaulis sp.]MBO6731051.1 hypothetical protein [Maricaulis sp.]MBO6846413.1 hypothetical protein [Maricaulis sp.]MBO6876644.1 hypothetical protein [Maricaulis sp.]MDM7983006.1 hypothetical protein [Maricaulis sp.]